MNSRKRREIFIRLGQNNPNPPSELNYNSPFEFLIAVILSAQATDVAVNKATAQLFEVANTPQSMSALGEAALRRYIQSIGLYNTKARNIIQTCKLLVHEHGSQVPKERVALESLPGVGRKTANVVLNTAFGLPTIAVDTHIFRVANRTRLAAGPTALAVERRLNKVVPAEFKKRAHHWLILHGRYTCTARGPRCGECVIEDLCEWPQRARNRVD